MPRVLWMDDEIDTDRADYVEVWRHWFTHVPCNERMHLVCCNSLASLAHHLKGADTFDLLLLDVMLKRAGDTTYSTLGFPDEGVERLDAGVQIVRLLRNVEFDPERPHWLARYRETPVALLSASNGLQKLIDHYLDGDRLSAVHCLTKSVENTGAGQSLPDAVFRTHFFNLLGQLVLPEA